MTSSNLNNVMISLLTIIKTQFVQIGFQVLNNIKVIQICEFVTHTATSC